jgi:cytidine deaminase
VTTTPKRFRKLITAALAARRNAHAPYSKFRVGAALLTKGGKVYTGANVENASYGLTICAERIAVGKAVSEGHREFQAIACVAPHARLSPCGACRQALAEFGDCIVVCADSRNIRRIRIHLLSELLPESFRLTSTRHGLSAAKKEL